MGDHEMFRAIVAELNARGILAYMWLRRHVANARNRFPHVQIMPWWRHRFRS